MLRSLAFVFALALNGHPSQPPIPSAVTKPCNYGDAQCKGIQPQSQPALQGTQASPLWVEVIQAGTDQPHAKPDAEKAKDGPPTNWRSDPNGWVAAFTLLLAFIAAIQAGFFYWQLGIMKKSLADSKTAADAAKLAAEAAMKSADIATNSERAWVVDEIRQMEKLPNPNEVFAAYLTFKNFGRIPAQIMGLKIKFLTFRFEETDPLVGGNPLPELPIYDDEQYFLEIGDRGVILAPNQSLTVAQIFEEEGGRWTDFLQLVVPVKHRRLCCYGLISYFDGFNILRTNQFCYIWDPGFDPKGVIPNFRRFGPSNYNHAN
jgi:hypothetical protein